MKSSCVATLLICGTVLLGLPFVANLVYIKLVGSDYRPFLAGVLGRGAYWAPIIIGGLMILVGIAGSFSTRKQSTNS